MSEFANLYAPPTLVEHLSIILNDYLTLAMALGLPGLASFIGLVWLSWNRRSLGVSSSDNGPPTDARDEWLTQAYRAALIALFVGFWFDGGLFKLVLAAPFWAFLEITRATSGRDA